MPSNLSKAWLPQQRNPRKGGPGSWAASTAAHNDLLRMAKRLRSADNFADTADTCQTLTAGLCSSSTHLIWCRRRG